MTTYTKSYNDLSNNVIFDIREWSWSRLNYLQSLSRVVHICAFNYSISIRFFTVRVPSLSNAAWGDPPSRAIATPLRERRQGG